MNLYVAARSDVGMIRAGNEDSFFAEANERRGLFIVADGMGGHAAGEVASEMAVEMVSHQLAGALWDLPVTVPPVLTVTVPPGQVLRA